MISREISDGWSCGPSFRNNFAAVSRSQQLRLDSLLPSPRFLSLPSFSLSGAVDGGFSDRLRQIATWVVVAVCQYPFSIQAALLFTPSGDSSPPASWLSSFQCSTHRSIVLRLAASTTPIPSELVLYQLESLDLDLIVRPDTLPLAPFSPDRSTRSFSALRSKQNIKTPPRWRPHRLLMWSSGIVSRLSSRCSAVAPSLLSIFSLSTSTCGTSNAPWTIWTSGKMRCIGGLCHDLTLY